MNFQEYRRLALRTAKMFPTQRENLQHAVLGLTTEIGELATEVKRMTIYGKPMTEDMRLHMIEEIGDVQWYVPLGLLAMGLDALPEMPLQMIEEFSSIVTLADLTISLSAMAGGLAAVYMAPADEIDYQDIGCVFTGIVALADKIALHLSTTGDMTREMNIGKLQVRFPQAYSDSAAEARADKGGADARNS